jgi:hypothetical protein
MYFLADPSPPLARVPVTAAGPRPFAPLAPRLGLNPLQPDHHPSQQILPLPRPLPPLPLPPIWRSVVSACQKQIRSERVRMRCNEGCAPARSVQEAVAAVATRPTPPSTAAIQARLRDLRRQQYPATAAAAAAAATTGLAKVGQAQIRSRRARPYSC